MTASIRWDTQGRPFSIVFNDHYFCVENGYEEIRHVACGGNQLKERFTALDPEKSGTFTIIETGFGTGLHFCCAWEMWDTYAPSSWRLHFISVELFPVAVEDMHKALSLWPHMSAYRDQLTSQYRPFTDGDKHLYFNDKRIHLTLVFDHVVKGLQRIYNQKIAPNGADAWFLSGFAPYKNPEMWSDAVYAAMEPLSHHGTTLATFTVAGFVRRGLESRGFTVKRVAGFGRKKQILSGFFVRR